MAWTGGKRVSDKKTKAFINYVNENQDFLVSIGDYVFDTLSLSYKVIKSKCRECLKYQSSTCCSGNSYSMSLEQMRKLQTVIPDILSVTPDSRERVESYYRYGAFTPNGATTTRGSYRDWCLFHYQDIDGLTKCAIEEWCIRNNINPLEYKPYTCSLFPLEGIVTPNNKTFVFYPCEKTQDFSMHFYTVHRRVCLNESNMLRVYIDKGNSTYLRTVNCDNIVSDDLLSKMRPAYIELGRELEYICGKDVYEELVRVLSC